MPITSQHVTGFVVGLGVAAAGFYLYKMNQKRGRRLAGKPGHPSSSAPARTTPSSMTLEELVRQKENLEDLIAEREYAASQKTEAKPAEVESAGDPRRRPPDRGAVPISYNGGAAPSPLMGEGWGGGEN